MKKTTVIMLATLFASALVFASPKNEKKNAEKRRGEFKKPEAVTLIGTIAQETHDERTFYTLTTDDGTTYVLRTADSPDFRPEPPQDGKNSEDNKKKPNKKRKDDKKQGKREPCPCFDRAKDCPEPPKLISSEELSALAGKTASVTGFALTRPARPDFDGSAPRTNKKNDKSRPEPPENASHDENSNPKRPQGMLMVTKVE